MNAAAAMLIVDYTNMTFLRVVIPAVASEFAVQDH
jgi:hypothetical protein